VSGRDRGGGFPWRIERRCARLEMRTHRGAARA